MDLPEKLLPRISSRMGIQRLCFGPYNYQQLQEIISSRLKGIDSFEKHAIEFASRKVYHSLTHLPYAFSYPRGTSIKENSAFEFSSMDLFCLLIQVAAVSGDARRALEICRRAAELADYRSKKMDSISNNASTGEIVNCIAFALLLLKMLQLNHLEYSYTC